MSKSLAILVSQANISHVLLRSDAMNISLLKTGLLHLLRSGLLLLSGLNKRIPQLIDFICGLYGGNRDRINTITKR
ncbi:MAG: hypothetical protein IKW35_07730 [Paludibacteraceae bacterium]|nr:hypothetical protein [Paludibacteraceae bacterium]